jgi:hypothetical protein
MCVCVCTVKPMKLDTLVSRPPVTFGQTVTELAHSLDVTHGIHSTTWTPVSLQCWPKFHTQFHSLHFNSATICWLTWRAIQFLCHTVHGPKSPFINTTTSYPANLQPFPQVWTTDWNFLVATDPFKSVFMTGLCTCWPTRPAVSALWTVHLNTWYLHSEICTVPCGVRKLGAEQVWMERWPT